MGAAPTKFSTNLAKMLVSKQPHTELARIYSKNLRALAKMPTDYPYRKYTENVIMERAALVKNEPNIQELEKSLNGRLGNLLKMNPQKINGSGHFKQKF